MPKSIVLSEDQIDDLRTLIGYNWDDEMEDAAHHPGDEDFNGIFPILVRLGNLIDGTSHTPESLIKQAYPDAE